MQYSQRFIIDVMMEHKYPDLKHAMDGIRCNISQRRSVDDPTLTFEDPNSGSFRAFQDLGYQIEQLGDLMGVGTADDAVLPDIMAVLGDVLYAAAICDELQFDEDASSSSGEDAVKAPIHTMVQFSHDEETKQLYTVLAAESDDALQRLEDSQRREEDKTRNAADGLERAIEDSVMEQV